MTLKDAMAVYVSCAASRDIYYFLLDSSNGRLVRGGRVEIPHTTDPSPFNLPLAVSPNCKAIYAAVRGSPFPLAHFSINQTTGAPEFIRAVTLDDGMGYISLDRTGCWLFGISSFGGLIAVYPVSPDGSVQTPASQIISIEGFPHSIVFDSSNRFAFVALMRADEILQLHFDPVVGRLTRNSHGTIKTTSGSGPRHLRFHPIKPFLYCINECSGTISTFSFDIKTGTLLHLADTEMPEMRLPGESRASEIHISANGSFLYGSERGSGTISVFEIGLDGDVLGAGQSVQAEPEPRGFSIDPSGRYLVAGGTLSNLIALFKISPDTGRLTRIGTYEVGREPNWVEFVPLSYNKFS